MPIYQVPFEQVLVFRGTTEIEAEHESELQDKLLRLSWNQLEDEKQLHSSRLYVRFGHVPVSLVTEIDQAHDDVE